MEYKIALIPGDGIGPEIVNEAKKVLDKVCEKYHHTFTYSEVLLGGASIDVHGVPLTDEAIATAKAELEKVKAELQAADKADMATVDGKLAEISGRIQTLEQFKTTTETTLAALSAADTNLQKSITTLQADVLANAEQIGRNKAAIEAQIAALEAYKGTNDDAIAGLKADLEKLQAGELTEAMVAKIAAQVTEVVGAKLELISAAFSKAVTHVELCDYTFGGGNEDHIIAGASSRMDLRTTLAVEDRVFGKGSTDEVEAKAYTIANQKEFKKGERAFLTDSVLIRVSPTNATLTEGQIQIGRAHV